jgi:hypothetical protein
MKSKNSLCIQLLCFISYLSFSLFTYADDDDQRFKISEAKWDNEKSRLKVKGDGKEGKTVSVFALASNNQLGSVEVDDDDEWKIRIYQLSSVPCSIKAVQSNGDIDEQRVEDAPENCDDIIVSPTPTSGNFTVLAANDLGMHCADQDYRIFSILPPYNVLNAQVLRKGSEPQLMSPADGIKVTYKAVNSNFFSNFNDPTALPDATNSINSTSLNLPATQNSPAVFKNNFWDSSPASATGIDKIGFVSYEALFPPDVLSWFPSTPDLGLPAPDVVTLYFGPDGVINTGDEALVAHQAAMPGLNNTPQEFHGYVQDFPFFCGFSFWL